MSDRPERDERLALLKLYVQALASEPDPVVRRGSAERLLSFHDDAPLGAPLLESVAEIANEKGDTDIHKRALELLTRDPDTKVRTRALERLGDVYADLGDRRAAIESWRPAAQMREDTPSEAAQALRLYERVLDTLPDDIQAAERLTHLYADAGKWEKIPEVLGVVIRGDAERGAALVLRLEDRAYEAGALEKLASMIDEAAALIKPTSTTTRRLRRAKARALSEIPARHAEAAATYRGLLETFGKNDDPREYQSFIESRPNPREQLWERRWLYQWRARNDERPADALLEWAKDEEQFGEVEEASAVYRRALEVAAEPERPALALKLCALHMQLGRVEDALLGLSPLLVEIPRIEAAHAVARQMLGERSSGGVVAERLERMAKAADDATAGRLFEVLIGAHDETAALPDARRRWYRAAVALSPSAFELGLPMIIDGACAMPEEAVLWDAAERRARELGQLDIVAGAYRDVLRGGNVDAALAETLGRRMIALEGECAADASVFIDALEKVLELAPCARWALDRVKLALGSQGRWDALFGAFDRATAAASDEASRIELLREAAVAARDLAGDTARAIAYFVTIRAAQPDDAAAAGALERLYEREDRKHDLVALLTERAAQSDRTTRRAFQRRVAALWIELGEIGKASAALESMLEDGAQALDMTDILERIVRHRGAGRASAPCVRALVRARVQAALGSPDVFARAIASIEKDIAGVATLAKVAYRAVLVATIAVGKLAETDAELDDALEGAWRAIGALRSLFIEAGDSEGAARLLARGARLRFSRERQRVLREDAAVLFAARAEDRERAIRLFTEIFAEERADAVAERLKSCFVELLLAAAAAWEGQGTLDRAIAAYEQGAALGSAACFDALARLYATSGEWTKALPALEWLCARSSAEVRAIHTIRLADALVALGQTDRARVSLEEVLEWSSAEVVAHDVRARLIGIYRSGAMWRCLADTLSAQGEESTDGVTRAALFSEAAAVLRDALAEPAAAARLLERAIASAPNDLALRPQLAAVLEGQREWHRVSEVLAEQIELYGARRSKERAVVHQQLASALVRASAARAPEALEQLQIAAKMHPTNPAILFDLARVALDAGDLDVAEKTYRALLLALRNAKDASPAFSCTPIFLDLADIAVRKGEQRRAADLLESGLDAAREKNEDARAFEEALRGIGRHDLVARAVESRVLRTSGGTAGAAALRELADLWREHLGREPELGARIRRHAEAVTIALGLEEVPHEGAWAALWSTHVALGNEAAMLAMVRERVRALESGDPKAAASVGVNPWLSEATSLCVRLEAYELAAKVYAVLLDAEPRNEGAWTVDPAAAWDLARALEKAGRTNDAVRLYESILDARPIDRETLRAIAARLEALGSARLADCLELCMELDAGSAPELAPRLVALREAQGDQARIVRALELGVAADPMNDAFLRGLAQSHRASGSPSAAIAYALRLVDVLVRAGRADEARRELDDVLARSPQQADALERLASIEHAAGAWDRAAGAQRRLVTVLEAGSQVDMRALSRAVLTLADACERAGSPADAREPLERAHTAMPDRDDLARRLEQVCETSGDVVRLVELLVARAEKTSDVSQKTALFLRAASLSPANELRLIELARAVSPQSIEAALAYANAQTALGRPRDALAALTEITSRSAGKRSPLLASAYLALGKAHLAVDELAEALDALKAGIAIDMRNGELAMLLGLVAIDLGDDKTAERALVAVVTLASRNEAGVDGATALYHLAAMAHAQGDEPKSRRWLGKALREAPTHPPSLALLQRLDGAELAPCASTG